MKTLVGILFAVTLAPNVQHFDFDDDQIEVTRVRPDLDVVASARRAKTETMIRVRTSFVPEMVKSAEDF